MVRKKVDKDQPEVWKPLISDELLFNIMQIVAETGLSPSELIQKWILQEKTILGFLRLKNEPAEKQAKIQQQNSSHKSTPVSKERAAIALPDPSSPDYRKALVKMAKKLKEEGMTLKKIADTFNDEKIPTVSGTGKWYSTSINNLLSSKK